MSYLRSRMSIEGAGRLRVTRCPQARLDAGVLRVFSKRAASPVPALLAASRIDSARASVAPSATGVRRAAATDTDRSVMGRWARTGRSERRLRPAHVGPPHIGVEELWRGVR